jgi:hypothetical protein
LTTEDGVSVGSVPGSNKSAQSEEGEGVQRNTMGYNGVVVEFRAPVECPVEEDDTVSDSEL